MKRERLTEFLTVRLSDEQRAILDRKARDLGTEQRSVALRAILTEWAREHQNGQRQECQEQTQ